MDHSFNNFVQGQSGGFYRIDVTNVGTAITSGTVTVSDTLSDRPDGDRRERNRLDVHSGRDLHMHAIDASGVQR